VVVFYLNHGTAECTINLDDGNLDDGEWTDLLTGATVGGRITIPARDAVVARRTR
jgi:hypothetical protein